MIHVNGRGYTPVMLINNECSLVLETDEMHYDRGMVKRIITVDCCTYNGVTSFYLGNKKQLIRHAGKKQISIDIFEEVK